MRSGWTIRSIIFPRQALSGSALTSVHCTGPTVRPTQRFYHSPTRPSSSPCSGNSKTAQENLENSIEELQSANEELETTNEELQSTNEELETINEESRSSNEEMESANEELRILADQAAISRAYLESVLRSLNVGVVVIDDKWPTPLGGSTG